MLWHRRCLGLLLRFLRGHRFSRKEQACYGCGVLQGRADDLGWIDDSAFDQVFIFLVAALKPNAALPFPTLSSTIDPSDPALVAIQFPYFLSNAKNGRKY